MFCSDQFFLTKIYILNIQCWQRTKKTKSYVFMGGATVCGLVSVGFCLWNRKKIIILLYVAHTMLNSVYANAIFCPDEADISPTLK